MENKWKVTANEYLPLRDVVFNTLRQAILTSELKPGERLMEVQLAERLGVSRTPIREAIRKLELEGLVIMIPRKGAEVASITEKDLNDVLEVRCALEELAFELASEKISKEQLIELRVSMNEFKKAAAGNDITLIAERDVIFHDLIYAATENQRLIQLLNNLREQMYRYRLEYLKDTSSHTKLMEEHDAMVKSLEEHNIPESKKIIKDHIYNQIMAVQLRIKEET